MPTEWTEWAITYGGVSEVRVTVQGPVTQSTITDTQGQYGFANLPWGTYTVHVDVPPAKSFLRMRTSKPISLAVERACAEVSFVAQSRSRIAGIVLDERGEPARNAFLKLEPADYFDPAQGPGIAPGFGVSTDTSGRYAFDNLPPGRYIVGVNTIGPTPGSPYAEAYAVTADNDNVVSLAVGERVADC